MLVNNVNSVALNVLKKYDSLCHDVIDSSSKVKLFNYDKIMDSWVPKDNSEGALYLVKRLIDPLYKMIILGKTNKAGSLPSPTEIGISPHFQSRLQQHYYMFKNESGVIQAVCFANKEDCDRISGRVDNIIAELRRGSDTSQQLSSSMSSVNHEHHAVAAPTTSRVCNEHKLISLLETARTGQVLPASGTSTESRARQIDIQELFGPSEPPPNRGQHYASGSRVRTTTLTVAELERKLVQDATVASHFSPEDDEDDEEDDSVLMEPGIFENPPTLATVSNDVSTVARPHQELDKSALRDALIHLLQTDEDGSFISAIHSAYLEVVRQPNQTKPNGRGQPPKSAQLNTAMLPSLMSVMNERLYK